MAYQMAATAVTLNDHAGHSQVAGVFKCNPSNMYAAFCMISTDGVLARFLCIRRASCYLKRSRTPDFKRGVRRCLHTGMCAFDGSESAGAG